MSESRLIELFRTKINEVSKVSNSGINTIAGCIGMNLADTKIKMSQAKLVRFTNWDVLFSFFNKLISNKMSTPAKPTSMKIALK